MEKDGAEMVAPLRKKRLLSLDALRGFDMFWIVCGEYIFHGLAGAIKQKYALTQNAVDYQIATTGELSFIEKLLVGISNQLHHSVWNGFTFYDLIFPLFIFIAGVSMPYSIGSQLRNASTPIERSIVKRKIYRSLAKRTIILIILGMVVNGLLQWKGYSNTRFASVLGRIALSCFFAALIYVNCSLRKQLLWFAGLLLGYWAIMLCVPVPGIGSGVLTPEGNLAAYIDRLLLPGKLHRTIYDPEGLLATIPAIGSALLGVFTGQFLLNDNYKPLKKTLWLFVAGIVSLLAGKLWDLTFPINKNMWTSSFVLYAGGWSVVLFSFFYFIIDVQNFTKWCLPFVWMGANSILIYMAAHGVIDFAYTSHFLFGGLINQMPPLWSQSLIWIGVAIIQFSFLFFLYKKKWFLKL
jgi:predicted acyltransferase